MKTKDEKAYEIAIKIYNNLCNHYNTLEPVVIVPNFIFNMIFDEIKKSLDIS